MQNMDPVVQKKIQKRIREELGMPRLIMLVLLNVSGLIRLLPKKVRARIHTPMLRISLEESSGSLIAIIQDAIDKELDKSEKARRKLLERPIEESIEEALDLYPALGPYRQHLCNHLENKRKEYQIEERC